MNVITRPASFELVLKREIAAPRERVFAAWTDVRQSATWWAPRDFTILSCVMDVRPGGKWHRRMRSPGGAVVTKHGVYREVVPPERLVFTYISEHEGGGIDPETVVTVTFADLGGRTRLTLRHSAFKTDAARTGHEGGWASCLERFSSFIVTHQAIDD
jgi:uncharacterized protein YndB with AHSA1/START domain